MRASARRRDDAGEGHDSSQKQAIHADILRDLTESNHVFDTLVLIEQACLA
jgi:hypothetical protein